MSCHTGYHNTNMDTAAHSFGYLQSQGYLDGTNNPPLIQTGVTCLSWFGTGPALPPMPQCDPPCQTCAASTNAQAVSDLKAWAAAGAKND